MPSRSILNQYMTIDGIIGKMQHTQVRPAEGNYMDLRAENEFRHAWRRSGLSGRSGKPVDVMIYQT